LVAIKIDDSKKQYLSEGVNSTDLRQIQCGHAEVTSRKFIGHPSISCKRQSGSIKFNDVFLRDKLRRDARLDDGSDTHCCSCFMPTVQPQQQRALVTTARHSAASQHSFSSLLLQSFHTTTMHFRCSVHRMRRKPLTEILKIQLHETCKSVTNSQLVRRRTVRNKRRSFSGCTFGQNNCCIFNCALLCAVCHIYSTCFTLQSVQKHISLLSNLLPPQLLLDFPKVQYL
jgi:hypothetical protein